MLLKKEHINTVMNLTAETVTLALHNTGYPEDSVKTAVFGGMTPYGSFVYYCTYADRDTKEDEDCVLYVRYNDRGVMLAEY